MITCIYHGNCADGFGAAWVVRKAVGEDATFHAAAYGKTPPDVRGHTVYIVDFSYPRETLLSMAESAARIVILDHHKTAQETLRAPLPANVEAIFDMNRSGARIAWDYFFPSVEPPRLIQHIEDRDLWRFAIDGTREVQAGLFSYPYDFATWDRLADDASIETLYHDGVAIVRKQAKDVTELVTALRTTMKIGGHLVPVANLPYILASDAGDILAQGEPFAAVYWDTPNGRQFSLRSGGDGIDVEVIARGYGGGGHAHAAGFRVGRHHPLAGGSIPFWRVFTGALAVYGALLAIVGVYGGGDAFDRLAAPCALFAAAMLLSYCIRGRNP